MSDKGQFGHTGGKQQGANTDFMGLKERNSAINVAADEQNRADKGSPGLMVNTT